MAEIFVVNVIFSFGEHQTSDFFGKLDALIELKYLKAEMEYGE